MDELDWNPDPAVIADMERIIRKTSDNERIALGTRVLTWQDVLQEVKDGTPFGRSYYRAYQQADFEKAQR